MSSKREKPKWQTLDNFFTKAPVPSTQDHDHNTPTNSDSHAETPSNNIDSVTSKIDDEVCSNPTTMSKPIHKNLPFISRYFYFERLGNIKKRCKVSTFYRQLERCSHLQISDKVI